MGRSDEVLVPGRDTAVARFALSRANEELVLAESSLRGERRVAWVRLALMALLSLSQGGIAHVTGEPLPPHDFQRVLAIVLYGLFSVVALLVLRRQRPHLRHARWLPVPTTVADTSFFAFMGWHAWARTGQFDAGMLGASMGMVLVFSVARFSWLHVLLSTTLSSVGYALVAGMSGHGTSSSTSFVVFCYVTLGLLIAMTNAEVGSMFLRLRRRDGLSRFLPKQVVERVMQSGDTSLQPVQREVTILFSDIRDFTMLSETLPPREVLELLDEYFGQMTHIVMTRGGIVNKFLGDGMLACWGVPDSSEDHAERAMRAALDMREKLGELNARRVLQGLSPLRIGIGLHTGVVAAGMLGGAEQHEYTVIGDAVNLASRVEGLTKVHGVDILVSESTWLRGGGDFTGRRLGETHVKGRREAVVVHALHGHVSGAPVEAPPPPARIASGS
ncbi:MULTISPECIES: adenylate/guanylate cyclase domain-containing protein [Myxococcus]|uniref:Adenylate/guanylate cyclase domain-containing protein n=1 Tax=Myxococcus llanfairpwllgwyngyllgogerychwyrndrobwllllantysiliogogogochensis TaxID=2590453 RepID=A0A540WIN1_9BACT|nr:MULTISPECIES: adenylate/guanylate cyclase domain-containing protein [Myxococcus]NTX05210.1 adenylate/guanylate cyclase domain-containing protein [Myxococcus sp. CA040A]TQF08852.1 adenylate/guanylate cyclase domain-containing protein [Myxococcus llanfairpwllgwyngyllgogerychwyrndrobwllllantysiliogogogochensis]